MVLDTTISNSEDRISRFHTAFGQNKNSDVSQIFEISTFTELLNEADSREF